MKTGTAILLASIILALSISFYGLCGRWENISENFDNVYIAKIDRLTGNVYCYTQIEGSEIHKWSLVKEK